MGAGPWCACPAPTLIAHIAHTLVLLPPPPEGSVLPGLRRSCRMTTGSPTGLCRIPQSSLVEKGAKKVQNAPQGPIHSPAGGHCAAGGEIQG